MRIKIPKIILKMSKGKRCIILLRILDWIQQKTPSISVYQIYARKNFFRAGILYFISNVIFKGSQINFRRMFFGVYFFVCIPFKSTDNFLDSLSALT